jgi:pyruvate dehydrogenase E1 component
VDSISPSSDRDPQETSEWIESVESVVTHEGRERARYLLARVLERSGHLGVEPSLPLHTDYVNTVRVEDEPQYPGDRELERRIGHIIRWNAVAMVHNANKAFDGIGGHISTYASSAVLYEVGLNHFFRGKDGPGPGDQIYFQGHAAPGMYARAFLEGRLTIAQLERFRRESARGMGLSSYPHPRLMPDFWEFPTVSMGLGPINSIYQARFNRYLAHRGIADTANARVWCFIGDGESDEPETLGALQIATKERLDNLVFVVNCNLQRLDGPVRGNGKIIQDLEGMFRGAGWNVIKVIWGPEWDEIFGRDHEGVLRKHLNEVVDGQWQRLTTAPGDVVRNEFFARDPRMLDLISHISDQQLAKLRRGGHSYRKVYAAYRRAFDSQNGRPTVILAHTVKGWLLGEGFEGVNRTHQKKKLDQPEVAAFRDILDLPIPDSELDHPPFYHPGPNSPEIQYLQERRRALGGYVPSRRNQVQVNLELPAASFFEEFYQGSKGEVSTTMVFGRLLDRLIRDKKIGKRVVPIVPDEAQTFGINALFGQVGIYSPVGQLYEPIDKMSRDGKKNLLYYREAKDGQVLQEGITEAGSVGSFIAASTSYATHAEPMIPFYIFYSMFGFQRTGDSLWAAGDSMCRGFVLGATAGRTTLNGEGLQHEDGHSLLIAQTVPSVRAYDVAFAFELATIIDDGLHVMFERGENVYYYITLQNENYAMPKMPEGVREGVIQGIYPFNRAENRLEKHVQLWGSGSIMMQVLRAQQMLAERFGVSSDVWGVTSYQRLRSDALECERWNRLHPDAPQRVPYITQALKGVEGPFIAASDYMKALSDQLVRFIPGRLVPLGTDGYGMSDTREALRRHFEVDAESIVIGALDGLRLEGKLSAADMARAIAELGVDTEKVPAPNV